jgi:hypothetical protein
MAQQIQAAMLAHINEHVAFEYRKQMEMTMGMELPYHPNDDQDDKEMPEEMEVRISQMAAQASQILLKRDQNEIAAQQAAQAQQDPIVQMQQQELQIKQQEVELKAKKIAVDAAGKADQLELEKARIMSQNAIAKMQVEAKTQKDATELAARTEMEGTRLGIDIAKSKEQMALQRRQTASKPDQSGKEDKK